jgi:hypothetical protein
MRPDHPMGESSARPANPITDSYLGGKPWPDGRPNPPQSATEPGELQPGSGSEDPAALA